MLIPRLCMNIWPKWLYWLPAIYIFAIAFFQGIEMPMSQSMLHFMTRWFWATHVLSPEIWLNNADSRPKLVAGSPEGFPGHVDGKLREARMNHPKGFTVDDRGNIYVADAMNMAIRKISDTGKLKCPVVGRCTHMLLSVPWASYVCLLVLAGLVQRIQHLDPKLDSEIGRLLDNMNILWSAWVNLLWVSAMNCDALPRKKKLWCPEETLNWVLITGVLNLDLWNIMFWSYIEELLTKIFYSFLA